MSFPGERNIRPPSEFREKPLARASWVAQSLPKLLSIPGSHIPEVHAYTDPESATTELFTATFWVPRTGTSQGTVAHLEGTYEPPHATSNGKKVEVLSLKVPLPGQWQSQKELNCFLEQVNTKISWQVDPKTHDHDDNPGIEKGLSVFALTDDESDEQLYLSYYYTWEQSRVPYGNRETYLTQALSAFSRSYQAACQYLPTFTQREIPKLVKQREHNVKTKPHGMLARFIKNIPGSTMMGHYWETPETGIDPDMHAVVGTIPLQEVDYDVILLHQAYEANYARMSGNILFPEPIQQALIKSLGQGDKLAVLGQTLMEYLEKNNLFPNLIVYPEHMAQTDIQIGLVVLGMEHDTHYKYGWSFNILPYQVNALQKQGISQETILSKVVASARDLHRHLTFFARMHYGYTGK